MPKLPEYLHKERAEDASSSDARTSNVRPVHRYWVAPARMASLFVAGVILAVAHHVYYMKLNNTTVGSTARQQWPIRFGTAFAFFFQTCLASATGIAYVQWLWRRFRQKAIKIGTLDLAFNAERNFFILFNAGFIGKFPRAAWLMVIFWCIPLSSVIAPATLGVASMPDRSSRTMTVPQPSISDFSVGPNYVYSPRAEQPTKLMQLLTIMASTGELPRLSLPENIQNISYIVDLIVPIARCQISDETERSQTAAAAYEEALSGSSEPGFNRSGIDFDAQNLAFTIDSEDVRPETARIGYYATVVSDQTKPYEIDKICFAIANVGSDSNPHPANYYTCTIRNASVTANISFSNNIQTVQITKVQEVELVKDFEWEVYGNDSAPMRAFENYMIYASKLYNQLSGFVMDSGSARRNWTTAIDQTILGTAKDFAAMTDGFKDEKLEDPAAVQDKNLTTLFEEYSLNVTLGLMSMPRYNNMVQTKATQSLWLNKYTYSPRNLLIAYGSSILACLVTIVAGGYAFYFNGESHDSDFSSISRAMQNPDIAAIFESESAISKKSIANTKIRLRANGRFDRGSGEEDDVPLNPL